MKKTLNILILAFLYVVVSNLTLIAQEQNLIKNHTDCSKNSISELKDIQQCPHKSSETASTVEKVEDHKLLAERVDKLESQLNPLLEKIEVLKTLIHKYENERTKYKSTNLDFEDIW